MTARISSPSLGAASYQEKGKWTAAVTHRWQYSDRHFVGGEEQVYREKEGSQVINDVHVIDVGISYAVSKRVNLTVSVPYQRATRSQTVRDTRRVGAGGLPARQTGNNDARPFFNPSPFPSPDGVVRGAVISRYQTEASGLSDIKLQATSWLLDPDTHKKGNISVGLGVLFPTGEKDVQDVPKTAVVTPGAGAGGTPATIAIVDDVRQNVDNSIQPGAGAWGIIFDIGGFMEVYKNLNIFAAGTYIATPQETAGVLSGAGPQIWSVGDSFLFRSGFGYTILPKYGLTFTLGGRMEGSPSTDLIGGSGGRRRPGFAISIEPGLVFAKNGWSASFSAPVALYRNRERSFGSTTGGDAAFADFITMFSLGKTF